MSEPIDLGEGHTLTFFGWARDRALNPQWADIPDVERASALIAHQAPDGSPCQSTAVLDTLPPEVVPGPQGVWHVESWDPLTLSPSLLCTRCGDHGSIQEGRWVPA